MARKIAIVAKAGTSALAPWHDETWEIWGMPWISYPRVTHLFEIHEAGCSTEEFTREWRSKAFPRYDGVPIYCAKDRMHEFNDALEFPLEAVKGVCKQNFLENTICYQLGFALLQGDVEEIALYGVHMMGRDEFDAQKAFLMYVYGVAEGKGIKITVADGAPLFMSPFVAGRYGVNSERR